jgi:hypothetical protein
MDKNILNRISLVVLGVPAIICSRTLFLFIDDPEGPNLLIVVGLALAIYLLSLGAYVFGPAKMKALKIIPIVIGIQILLTIVLSFCMKRF